MTPDGDILLTGATGFVGMEVLARLLERTERRVIALVRARDDAAAGARIDDVLTNMLGDSAASQRDRIEGVAADMTAERLGLAPGRYDELAARARTIIHSAASVSFALPLEEARAINLNGTRRMLDLARRASELGGLERYAHVSTAYVAGLYEGRFAECDLDVGQAFRNSYEQSKFEAEKLVRACALPYTILRPSIVVGDRHSGWTSAFNVLYWPLRAFARGLFTAVPALPGAHVDVVSVDFVADAIHALCEDPGSVGETYHLTAGAHASTIGEIARLASRYFRRPQPNLISPAEFEAATRSAGARARAALASGQEYFPYFAVQTTFDDAHTRARLSPAGIQVSPLGEYIERLLDFATRSRWGKHPIARADAFVF